MLTLIEIFNPKMPCFVFGHTIKVSLTCCYLLKRWGRIWKFKIHLLYVIKKRFVPRAWGFKDVKGALRYKVMGFCYHYNPDFTLIFPIKHAKTKSTDVKVINGTSQVNSVGGWQSV